MRIARAVLRGLLAACLALPCFAGAQSFNTLCTFDGLELAAAGNRSIWAATSRPNQGVFTFQYDPGSGTCFLVPMLSQQFQPLFLASGGGSLVQPDETWAYFQSQGPFHFSGGAWNQPVYVGTDPAARRYAVGVGYADDCHPYEAWVERFDPTSNLSYLGRFDYCYFGGIFVSVLAPPNLSHVATGGGEVWALDTAGHVYRFDGGTQAFNPMPGSLSQIAVGVDGVWGLDASGHAFEFNPVTQSWDALNSPQLDAIWAGGDGVFARQCLGVVIESAAAARIVLPPPLQCGVRQLVRYQPVTRAFVPIKATPQPFDLNVGSGAGAVGVDTTLTRLLQWTE